MFSFKRRLFTLAAATAIICGSAGSVIAQDQSDTAAQPTQTSPQTTENNMSEQPETIELTEAKIDAYAETAIEVVSIQQEMVPQIQAAEDEEQKKELFQNMQQEMMSAVQGADNITVNEYNAISQEAQQNPELANLIQTKIQATQ